MTVTVRQRIEAQGCGTRGPPGRARGPAPAPGRRRPARRLRPRHRRRRQVDASRGVRRSRRATAARPCSASTAGAIEPTARGFLAALAAATGIDLQDRRGRRRPARQPRASASSSPSTVRGPPAARLLAAAGVRPFAERQRPGRLRRSRAADAGLVELRWAALPQPAAGQPAARRCRDAAAPGRRRPAMTSSGSTGWRGATRCRCGLPPRRSWPGPNVTTRPPRSRRSSRS